jgi:integrase
MSIRIKKYRSWTGREGVEVDLIVRRANGEKLRERRILFAVTQRTAQGWANERHAQLLAFGHQQPTKEPVPTFSRFVNEQWLPVYPSSAGNGPSTVAEKEKHIELHLEPVLGSMQLDRIDARAVSRLFAELRGKGLAPKYIKNIRATLRTILATAVKWDVIEKLPELDRIKVPEVGFDFFNAEEAQKLIEAGRNEDERVILLFALRTGARAGEQLALEWGDIDWVNRKVIFRRSRTGDHVGPTKSGKHRRVPITSELGLALKQLKLRSAGNEQSPLVFCRGGQRLTLWQLHEHLWGTCRRAGLRKIRWHDLRHSFASQLVQANVPLRQVQEWLGHSTITMSMRYAHLSPEAGDRLIHALDRGGGVETAETEKKEAVV